MNFNSIAKDIELCELGAALTRGESKRRFIQHREKCFEAIKKENTESGLDAMTADDIFAELKNDF